jgi:hypothetical protein
MKFITDESELVGKTIAKATVVDYKESVALVFTDDTCAVFTVYNWGRLTDIILRHDAEDRLKRDAGIISDEEYKARLAREEAKKARLTQEHELDELARLKEKYGV